MQMAIVIQDIGKMIKHMVRVDITIQTVLNMMESGIMINKTGMELKNGVINRYMKDIFIKVKNMEKGSSNGGTDLNMKETFMKTLYKDMEYIGGQMGDSMKANGRIIKCMDKEYLLGQMEKDILVIM